MRFDEWRTDHLRFHRKCRSAKGGFMKCVLFLTIALSAGFTNGVFAQHDQQPSGYHSVSCVKVRDGKMAEFLKFLNENHKLGQAAADTGRMSARMIS
jgi:hypothetical protein